MKLTASQYRSFLQLYIKEETAVPLSTLPSIKEARHIADLQYHSPTGSLEKMPVYVDPQNSNTPCIVETESSEVFILISLNSLIEWSDEFVDAVLAHELGHHLCGHLNSSGVSFIDLRKVSQARFYNLASQHQVPEHAHRYYRRYMSAVLSALLEGGVLDKEWEADIQALHYVSVASLVAVHSADLLKGSSTVRLEKHNRIARLSKLVHSKEPLRYMELVFRAHE